MTCIQISPPISGLSDECQSIVLIKISEILRFGKTKSQKAHLRTILHGG